MVGLLSRMTMPWIPDMVPVIGGTGHPGYSEFLMVQVVFTPNLQRHVTCPPVRVTGSTVAEALDRVFADNPTLRRYVLDDQGALRKNMVIFVDGRAMKDRRTLGDGLSEDAEVFVMQALTGG